MSGVGASTAGAWVLAVVVAGEVAAAVVVAGTLVAAGAGVTVATAVELVVLVVVGVGAAGLIVEVAWPQAINARVRATPDIIKTIGRKIFWILNIIKHLN